MAGRDQQTHDKVDAANTVSVTEIAPLAKAEIIGLTFDDSEAERELERRLLEFGFVEGARISILHEGLFGKDPIVIQLDDTRVAVRRAQASRIKVRTLE